MSHATFCRSRGDEAFPCCLDCGSAYSVTSFRAANVMFGATLFWREAAAKRLVITVVQTSESNSVVPSRCPASQRHHVATSRSPRMLTFLTQVPAITNSNLQSLFPTSPRRHVTPSLPQKCRLFFCKSLQSSFSPSQPLAFTIFTLKKSAPGSHTQLSTLNQKFQSTFHHQRPVFTTCLHFFTYSHTPFRTSASPRPTFQTVRLFCHLSIWKFLCHLCRCHLSFLQNVAFPVASTCNGQLRPFPFHSRSHASLVKCISG